MTTKTTDTTPVRAHVHWGMKFIAGFGVLMCVFWGYLAVKQGSFSASLGMLTFALLSGYVFLAADTKLDADEHSLQMTAPRGVFRIAWVEIKSFEVKGTFVWFFGENKAFGYNTMFGGRGTREFSEYVRQEVERRQIPFGRPAGLKDFDLEKLFMKSRIRGWKLF